MTPHEQQTDLWRRLRWLCTHRNDLWLNTNVYKFPFFFWFHHIQGLLPGFGLNYTMFHAVVQACGNEEQKAHWLPLIQGHKILGCYAQTELGHGSNVQGLETTATFD